MSIKISCKECQKRSRCKTLCKKAELHVNQDEVKWDHLLLSGDFIERGKFISVFSQEVVNFPKDFEIARMFFLQKKTTRQIADIVGLSHVRVSKIIKKIKIKIDDFVQ